LVGIVLAGVSCYFLREYQWRYGVIAVVITLIEAVALGAILGVKRAMVMTLAYGLGSLQLGRTLVRLVFERMQRGAAGEKAGSPNGRIAEGLKRLPLAQADELLSAAIRDVTGGVAQGGWLRRKVQTRLLNTVRKYTLARFREEGARQGGVDLPKVQEELEQTIDEILVRKVRGGVLLFTVAVMVGFPLAVAAQTYLILVLLRTLG
jgi:hypothetical protein